MSNQGLITDTESATVDESVGINHDLITTGVVVYPPPYAALEKSGHGNVCEREFTTHSMCLGLTHVSPFKHRPHAVVLSSWIQV